MNIPEEIVSMFHYGYIGRARVENKLKMWRDEDTTLWTAKYGSYVSARAGNIGDQNPHLFGERNQGYANVRLLKYDGDHPNATVKWCPIFLS